MTPKLRPRHGRCASCGTPSPARRARRSGTAGPVRDLSRQCGSNSSMAAPGRPRWRVRRLVAAQGVHQLCSASIAARMASMAAGSMAASLTGRRSVWPDPDGLTWRMASGLASARPVIAGPATGAAPVRAAARPRPRTLRGQSGPGVVQGVARSCSTGVRGHWSASRVGSANSSRASPSRRQRHGWCCGWTGRSRPGSRPRSAGSDRRGVAVDGHAAAPVVVGRGSGGLAAEQRDHCRGWTDRPRRLTGPALAQQLWSRTPAWVRRSRPSFASRLET